MMVIRKPQLLAESEIRGGWQDKLTICVTGTLSLKRHTSPYHKVREGWPWFRVHGLTFGPSLFQFQYEINPTFDCFT